MKKLLVFLLLMMYGAFSFGMSLNFHYCCGKLKKVELSFIKTTEGCSHGKGAHKMGSKKCCDSKEIKLKIQDDQSVAKALPLPSAIEQCIVSHQEVFVLTPFSNKKLLPEIFAPPPLQADLTKLYCTYRI